MNRINIILPLLFLLSINIYAQEDIIIAGQDFRSAQSNAIVVKWVSKDVLSENGFNIYRQKEGEADWTQLNESPITPINNPSIVANQPEEIIGMFEATQEVSFSELQESEIFKAFLALNLLRNDKLPEALGTVWYDDEVTSGESYLYRIEGLGGNSKSIIGESQSISAGGNYKKVEGPSGISVELIDTEIKMKWDLNEEVSVSTLVEISENGQPFKPINELGTYVAQSETAEGDIVYPEYFISYPAEIGTVYKVRLAYIDRFGQKGNYSEFFEIKRKDITPPVPAENVEITLNEPDTTGLIKWTYDVAPEDFKSFVVLARKSFDDAPFLMLSDSLGAEVNQAVLHFNPGDNLLITVGAVDEVGNMSESLPVNAKVDDFKAPSIPTGLSLTYTEGKAELTWEPNQESDMLGYYLYRYVGNKGEIQKNDFTILNSEPYKDNSYTDPLPKELLGKISYSIAALDTNYNVSGIADYVQVPLPDNMAPSAPFIKNIDRTTKSISLTWLPNIDNDLAHFALYRQNNGMDELLQNLASSDTTYTDDTAMAGKEYIYYLVARDQSGNKSPRSNEIKATLIKDENNISGEIKPRNIIVKYMNRKRLASLWWDQNFTEENLGVVIYKGESEDELRPISGLLKETEFTDSKVSPGNTYYYQIRTFASNGAKDYSTIKTLKIKAE